MDPSVGLSHIAESTAAHCFVTVDLDLNAGYVRFFRNGHLIGSAFQGLTGPIAPALGFIQVQSCCCREYRCRGTFLLDS